MNVYAANSLSAGKQRKKSNTFLSFSSSNTDVFFLLEFPLMDTLKGIILFISRALAKERKIKTILLYFHVFYIKISTFSQAITLFPWVHLIPGIIISILYGSYARNLDSSETES